jgi:Secretion system C-terminal sorting domain
MVRLIDLKNVTIPVIDAAGKRVLSKKVIELKKIILNVSTLQSCVYVVEITNEKGEKLQQKLYLKKSRLIVF